MKAGLADRRWQIGDGEFGGKWKAGGGRGLSAFHLKPAPKRSASFTLIELLGVMAIIGILAAVVLPPLINRIEDARTVQEDLNQEVIADALLRGIKAYRAFPNPNALPDSANGWLTLAKNFYPKGTDDLRFVFPEVKNEEDVERRVYLDPILVRYFASLNSYSMPSTGFSSTSDLNNNGVVDFDETLRMYIVSSSKRDLPLYCTKNGPSANLSPAPQDAGAGYGQALVNDLLGWAKTPQPPDSANAGSIMVPQSIARWGEQDGVQYRRGEFLHVKIVPLDKIFCKVQLIDCATPPTKKLTGGNGYPNNATVLGTDGYGSSAFVQANNAGSIAVGQNKDGSWYTISRYNDRATYPVPNKQVISPGNADFTFTLPAIPKYQLNNLLANIVTPQKTEFYVLTGTQLKLLDSASTVLLTIIIYDDSTFSYREGKWAPGD